ncbi:MAG: permease [Pirellulaceae bacterium]
MAILVRAMQVLIDSAPWLVVGAFAASWMRNMVGRKSTRAIFGGTVGWKNVLFGWCWGMLLPVCSLGVIPVIREMHQAGVRGPALVAFAMSAPLFNPLSVLFGLTLADPIAVIVFAFANLLTVSVIAAVVGILMREDSSVIEAKSENFQMVNPGIFRSIAVIQDASTDLIGQNGLWVIIGIMMSATMSTLLPHGFLSSDMEVTNSWAPMLMAVVMFSIYSGPLQVMGQVGSMFQHGNSVAAAFSLMIFGAGMNVGLFVSLWNLLGKRVVIIFIAVALAVTIALSFLVGNFLQPSDVIPLGHTHAFDVYTNPWPEFSNSDWTHARSLIEQHYQGFDFGGGWILFGLLLIGFGTRVANANGRLDTWLRKSRVEIRHRDIHLPQNVLVILGVAGLISFSILGCFLYYPPKDKVLDDMKYFNTEAVSAAKTGEWDSAMKWILFQDDLARRLEVGIWLRERDVPDFLRIKGKIYREYLDELRHEIEDQDLEHSKITAMKAHTAFRRLYRAYSEDGN